ncbi:hypothetical protein MMC13_003828 [Lambiella insularis]|nr:hypothetical protein [Lambiella insularis]
MLQSTSRHHDRDIGEQVSQRWLSALTTPAGVNENHSHYWGNDPSILITSSAPQDFTIGTGLDIYHSSLIGALEHAEQEVLFVTCFWARSPSLSLLSNALVSLSRKALARSDGSRIRVRLCFSSTALFQKLFHTSSLEGQAYAPSQWNSKLGLPAPEELRGLDLHIKSIFARPFSVMHPKFMVVDSQRAFFPSSNLSWERWLECSITVRGPVVSHLVEFWVHIWGRNDSRVASTTKQSFKDSTHQIPIPTSTDQVSNDFPLTATLPSLSISTVLLPSPHHSSFFLSMSPFIPFAKSLRPPLTPLNTFLLDLLGTATTSIRIVSPNLTCQAVISALQDASIRGVDVSITTNRRMMLLEQLFTAGTITEYEVWKTRRKYQRLRRQCHSAPQAEQDAELALADGGRTGTMGKMQIGYFHPRDQDKDTEPVKCHIKCTVVDEEVIVLGSGNMDRASFFTSQELGVALYGRQLVGTIWNRIQEGLSGRVEEYPV